MVEIPFEITIPPRIRLMLELGMDPSDVGRFEDFTVSVDGEIVRNDGKVLPDGEEYEWYFAGLARDTPPPQDVPYFAPNEAAPQEWLEVWYARLTPKGSDLYAELRWRPGAVATFGMHGPRDAFEDDYERGLRALNFLARQMVGAPTRDPEVAKQVARMRDEEGKTTKEIAKYFGWRLSPDDYGKLRRSAKVDGHLKLGRELLRTEKSSE